ncbi:alpha/beta hydrolase [Citrobacter amalonaticus]|uniref:Alpha/beta hydrolase n=1 Tax=Citrobacter amalonaticus TaxID=35703 RepID=A0A2S4S062_CITAM|nr:alpha/beta hydrolase [Citrobacter amalonaticus]POT58291.1 alpha/beta hydrolase [Citrobacter amalonaticus]POT76184.1 alpha/beta hydrolase [Citrobacter amalonaticus]POU66818.1 alpha/beta hydrolase [Citrobacter amalonaticus]POV05419.1 alpha/beta hydrolase [Citrobacter amalonaticus]
MALEPEMANLVNDFISAGCPSSRNQTFQERRAGYVASTALAGSTETRVNVEDMIIDTIPLRIFSPLNEEKVLPAVVYYHGGCFVSGGFSTHENQLRQIAFLSGFRVIAVQYRLAPEHTYPAAHDDAEYAANTVWKHAQALGIDRNCITLMGDSAGGHLALITALRVRSSGQWLPRQLVLIYPMLDATASSDSYKLNGSDYVITRDTLITGFEAYFPHTNFNHPDASPLFRNDFSGLPPIHIITAEYDPLRDEGEALFVRMTQQGVKCTAQRYLGVIHGFFQLGGISQTARNLMRDICSLLRSIDKR